MKAPSVTQRLPSVPRGNGTSGKASQGCSCRAILSSDADLCDEYRAATARHITGTHGCRGRELRDELPSIHRCKELSHRRAKGGTCRPSLPGSVRRCRTHANSIARQRPASFAATYCTSRMTARRHVRSTVSRGSTFGSNTKPFQLGIGAPQTSPDIERTSCLRESSVCREYRPAPYSMVFACRNYSTEPKYFDIAKRRIQEAMGMEVKGNDGAVQRRMFVEHCQ